MTTLESEPIQSKIYTYKDELEKRNGKPINDCDATDHRTNTKQKNSMKSTKTRGELKWFRRKDNKREQQSELHQIKAEID